MDKTESTVRNILTAVEAPLYDIGVLSDRGMLPGLDSIAAAAVLDRLSLLKYRNVRGSHIYIRPSGSTVSPYLTTSTRPRSRGSRRKVSILAPSLRQAPATSKPG
jgi:RepB DNA-primase from phage plasmid